MQQRNQFCMEIGFQLVKIILKKHYHIKAGLSVTDFGEVR